ncbi:hypothetical protein HY639_05750 [Candidatus Woesearchaeota archaeon]|nr:hypothetical protein [Candidatus Woesearchaeota archaeon]
MPYIPREGYSRQILETIVLGSNILDVCKESLLFSLRGYVAYKLTPVNGIFHIEDGEGRLLYKGRLQDWQENTTLQDEQLIISYILQKGEEYFFGYDANNDPSLAVQQKRRLRKQRKSRR